ncbi:Histidine kinase [Rhodovastum atsumiense]|nr:Histidine kinase [Rhodovastum atsumiense]
MPALTAPEARSVTAPVDPSSPVAAPPSPVLRPTWQSRIFALHGRASGYALAIAATALALALRFALAAPLAKFPFLAFFPAVVLTALFAGLGPALLASLLSIAAAKYFFIAPTGSFTFAQGSDVIATGFFGVVLLVDCAVIHVMTTSLRRERQGRAEFAASEARFRALSAATREGVVFHDGGIICDVNDAFWRMHGFAAREQVIGRNVMDLIAPEGRRTVAEAIRQESRAPYETLGLRRDGSTFPLEIEGRAVHYQGRPMRVAVARDLTSRKAAAAALAAGEARFRALAEAIPSLLFETDAEGQVVYLNPRFAEYAGVAMDELMGEGWLAILHPDDRDRTLATWMEAVRAGGTYEIEYRFRRHDGAYRWFLGRGVPVRDKAGQVSRWVGTCTDIDGRKRTEAALRDSESRLRLAAERVDLALKAGAIVGTWTWDLPTDHFTADARFAQSFGLDPETCRSGLGIEQVVASVHPEDLPRLRQAIAEVIARGGPYACEYRVRQHDGVYRWIQANGRVDHAPDGTPLRFPGVLLDIEERHAAAEQLRENEARLRLALEAGRMGFWSWDLVTDRLEWDAREFELFGIDPASGQPSGKQVYARLHPEDLPGLKAVTDAAIAAGNGAFGHEFRVVLPAGEIRWIAAHGHALADAGGRARRMVGLHFDVTARRQAEALLAREAEQLDRLAEERGQALAVSEARLAQASRMEALGRLAGGIAHDFNNILQAVQGGITLASRRLTHEAPQIRRYLDLAASAAERGASVTGRLLTFARRVELRSEPVPPAPFLEGLAAFLGPVMGANVTLTLQVVPELPPLFADRSQLEAVLVNLANNARDAMPAGGTLVISAEAVDSPGSQDAPPGLPPGCYLRLSVIDDGEGMSAEVLERVTEPFFTTKPKGQGTGLGLSMARGFAEQSGGGLSIRSAPGRGTTVSLWLPRAPAGLAPVTEATDATRAAPASTGATILLAEDKAEVRTVIAAQLEDHGYTTREAEDAVAALALLDEGFRPDALVTDLTMPGRLDGLDLLREARLRVPRLPAVLVTGHAGDAGPGKIEEAERGGPFALLRKPVAAEALLERLGRVLQNSGVRPAPPPGTGA